MYNPKGNSRDRMIRAVQFEEARPPKHLSSVVHRFLELKTTAPLPEDYKFHALPDACIYAVFDQRNLKIAGITKLKASSQELNLGKRFHFINIRFLPGVWQGDRDQINYGLIDRRYEGALPLLEVNQSLRARSLQAAMPILSQFVEGLLNDGLIVANVLTERILAQMNDINSVAEMASAAALSPRQLQRTLKKTTGFRPHDFLKILRLQKSLRGDDILSYADQSHFIDAFRKATGYTPGKFAKKFDV